MRAVGARVNGGGGREKAGQGGAGGVGRVERSVLVLRSLSVATWLPAPCRLLVGVR
jgi:hypothetical protein